MSAVMQPREQYTRAVTIFDATLRAMSADRYSAATPCADWDVRQLINHVVGEDRWAAELAGGRTVADVGDDLDGDLLGTDPIAAWSAAKDAAERPIKR
jgi:uncharacterized protein (TIGR03086 family)